MKREMTYEELPPNSWQREAFEKGYIFYGKPSDPSALNNLCKKVENNPGNHVKEKDQHKIIDSTVGKVAVAEQINCDFDPSIQDRYSYFIET